MNQGDMIKKLNFTAICKKHRIAVGTQMGQELYQDIKSAIVAGIDRIQFPKGVDSVFIKPPELRYPSHRYENLTTEQEFRIVLFLPHWESILTSRVYTSDENYSETGSINKAEFITAVENGKADIEDIPIRIMVRLYWDNGKKPSYSYRVPARNYFRTIEATPKTFMEVYRKTEGRSIGQELFERLVANPPK